MSSIHAISYYSNPLEATDQRPLFKRLVDHVTALFWDLIDCLKMAYQMFLGPQEKYRKFEQKDDSEALVVLVHGLFSHPSCWNEHLAELNGEKVDIYTPFVPYHGNCSLKDASDPIYYEIIKAYYNLPKNRQKPLCLIGHSRGGQIVHDITDRLSKDHPNVAVYVSSIAGAHFGSHVAKELTRFDKILPFFNPLMILGLSYDSSPARDLLERMKAPLPGTTIRCYSFYGTRDDLLVPLDSALPRIGKGEKCYIYTAIGHCALVPKVAKDQIESFRLWIKNYKGILK